MKRISSCKPTKMWIDGTCFNIRTLQKETKKLNTDTNYKSGNDEDTDIKYNINRDNERKLYTIFSLPKPYLEKLQKFPNWSLKNVEAKTNTVISISNNKLVVTGDDKATITTARNEIHSVLAAIRDRMSAFQFLCLPIRSDDIAANFNKFKNEILNGEKIEGMEESIFQRSIKLHLTIAVFSLLNEHETNEAVKALQDYKNEILNPLLMKVGPLNIRVAGVDCMNSNVKKVDVLFANAKIIDKEELSLQTLANGLSDFFYNRGLVRTYQENVKLHITLINTKYRKSTANEKRKRWVKRQSFDATTIMEKYKDFTFGDCKLDSIHLSLISSVGEDGFYKPISIINAS